MKLYSKYMAVMILLVLLVMCVASQAGHYYRKSFTVAGGGTFSITNVPQASTAYETFRHIAIVFPTATLNTNLVKYTQGVITQTVGTLVTSTGATTLMLTNLPPTFAGDLLLGTSSDTNAGTGYYIGEEW